MQLDQIATSSISVVYATSDGTALAGSDYTGVSNGSMTITAGLTKASFTVAITDDNAVESAETFNIMLNNPTGATLGAIVSTEVTITDNDTASPQTDFKVFLPVLVK